MDILGLKNEIDADIKQVKTEAECSVFHQKFLSKSGKISLLMNGIRDAAASERARLGAELNTLKRETESMLFSLQKGLKEKELRDRLLKDKLVDITIPDLSGDGSGSLHLITRVAQEVQEVFANMGFIVLHDKEIVSEYECFESLNVSKNHPARDMQDTFWLDNGTVLRTQTTASLNRLLKEYGPEFRAIYLGRTFRNENLDATHETTFFQVDGCMVGENVSIANLIYFLSAALSSVFKKQIKIRLRPGFFPFVEPGFEMDASCVFCGGEGCGICKKSGWIEFCGCGMIHPNVLKMGGLDPKKYQGFAFGFGLTRLAMLKYGIDDIRHFNSGNLEFLRGVK